jgi:uncharacterized cupin superfamily protein
VLAGEVTLVSDAGAEVLRAGDCAGFKAGDPDGHCLQNRGETEALVLEVGTRSGAGETVVYPDIDLRLLPDTPPGSTPTPTGPSLPGVAAANVRSVVAW